MKKEIDMLNGSLWNKILWFAIPMAASSMLQQLFNAADAAVVGRFAGKAALAAVGSNSSLINLIINMFVGLSVGTSVLVARYVGSGEKKKVSQAVHTSITIAAISGVFLVLFGGIASKYMLQVMATPSDVIDLATLYLRIYFCGMPFFMVYNFGVAILRSVGDTRRPLIVLVIAGCINVLLNLFFVIVCDMSVAGVGIATVVSNVFSAIMVVYFLLKEKGDVRLELKKLGVNRKIFTDILRVGIPAGVQGMVFSISNVIIQKSINGFGSTVVSASAAAVNFEFFAWFLMGAFTSAATTFSSQNFGAMKLDRCKRAINLSAAMSVASVIIFDAICMLFAEQLLVIFSTDPEVIEIGIMRMKYILMPNFIACVYETISGGMRGLGYSTAPALLTVIGVCVLRLFWVFTVFPQTQTFESLMMVYPLSWIATNVMIIASYIIVLRIVKKKFALKGQE